MHLKRLPGMHRSPALTQIGSCCAGERVKLALQDTASLHLSQHWKARFHTKGVHAALVIAWG